jgi:hypothetical protein
MKKAIQKFLGIDNLINDAMTARQQAVTFTERIKELERENANLRGHISNLTIDIDYDSLAYNIDYSELGYNLDSYDVAVNIPLDDLSMSLDYTEVAGNLDYDTLQQHITDAIDMDILAETVSEKIADRDGMHQLISEEIENQGGGGISQDAVQAMIDTAIQQFADSLEVMVSAKLNINK